MTIKNSLPKSFDNRLAPIQEEYLFAIGRVSYTFDPSLAARELANLFLDLTEEEEIKKLRFIDPQWLRFFTDVRLDVVEEICRQAAWKRYQENPNVPFDDSASEAEWAEINAKADVEIRKKAKLITPLVAFALSVFLNEMRGWLELSFGGLFELSILKTLRVHNFLSKSRNKRNELAARILEDTKAIIRELLGREAPMRGRPQGSRKSEEEGEKDKAQFEAEIKEAIKKLHADGQKITKTAVAKALHIGGINPKTGNQTYLQAFNQKLKRHKVDWSKLIDGVNK